MGIGLQNSQRMQKTDYGRGFLGGNITAGKLDDNETGQEAQGSPSKVFRSWSRPQIHHSSHALQLKDVEDARGSMVLHSEKPMQVCTCAKFRKRMDNMPVIKNKTPTRASEDDLAQFNIEYPKTS